MIFMFFSYIMKNYQSIMTTKSERFNFMQNSLIADSGLYWMRKIRMRGIKAKNRRRFKRNCKTKQPQATKERLPTMKLYPVRVRDEDNFNRATQLPLS